MPNPDSIDPEVRKLAEAWIAKRPKGRVATLLREILRNGSVTTEDLQRLRLSEPRRARQDAIDRGFPVVRETVLSTNGRHIASYSLGSAAGIIAGRKGRAAIPKVFRRKLLAHYGSRDAITGAVLDPGVLTVDHRVPYQIGGDEGLAEQDVSAFMLLDGSSQRSKSWSCENCPNFLVEKSPQVCLTCFWASPERYEHIATENIRRTDIVWQGADVPVHDHLREKAGSEGLTVLDFLKRLARKA